MNGFVQTSTNPNVKIEYAQTNAPKGWVCPKCGKVIAPKYDTCPFCSQQIPTDENLLPGQTIIYG